MKAFDVVLIGFTVGFMGSWLAHCTAKAEERLSEISPVNASYCALYSREMVFIDTMSGKALTADTDFINKSAVGHYRECLSILPSLLPLPDEGRHEAWLANMRDLTLMVGRGRVENPGTAPASEAPIPDDEETWRAQCRAEYQSWDEDTGTVIRLGGGGARVRCPCGGEVQCVR